MTMADGVTLIYSSANKRVSRFETVRPLRYLHFLATVTEMVAAADHGLVGRYSMRGDQIWAEKLWSNVGDIAVTGDGKHLFLAGFAHGIQAYDGQLGTSLGSFVTEGTVSLLACAFSKRQVVGATLERDLFAINDSGTASWNLSVPEDILRLVMSPLGDWIIVGFASGRIVRLDINR